MECRAPCCRVALATLLVLSLQHAIAAPAPLPRERPPEFSSPALPEPPTGPPQDVSPPTSAEAVPLPIPRPADLAPGAPSQPPVQSASDADCVEELRRAGATLEPQPAIAEGACGIAQPVRLTSLPNGVELKPAAVLNCGMARMLTAYVGQDVAPAAKQRLSAEIRTVAIATSYDCRSQNHVAGAKMSDHALGNAVDIGGFTLTGGRRVTIGDAKADAAASAFVDDIRKASCGRFTTVLGPGSDAEHGNHLHLDLRQRKNGYRICQ